MLNPFKKVLLILIKLSIKNFMKKILYIDPISLNGHIAFNSIYINTFSNIENVSVDFSFKQNYASNFLLPEDSLLFEIPLDFYSQISNRFISRRIIFIRVLNYLKKNILFDNYDFVILSNYEEISLFFSFIKTKLYLINHHNLQGLDNKVKLFFFRLISKKNVQVVFTNSMKEYLNQKSIKAVKVVSHGLLKPFKKTKKKINDILGLNFENYIFIPSVASCNDKFISNLIKDEFFLTKLIETNTVLIIKNKPAVVEKFKHNNIYYLNTYLSRDDYETLFIESRFIFLPYSNEFKNRVSGVLFEAIANNKLLILPRINSFLEFKVFMKFNPYYSNIEDVINIINTDLVKEKYEIRRDNYTNINDLLPKLETILI